jgi:hypothetical protein
MTLALGTRLGPYEILSPLGAGGMGEVYKARDTRLERTVAVKVLPSHMSESPEVRQRFEREAIGTTAALMLAGGDRDVRPVRGVGRGRNAGNLLPASRNHGFGGRTRLLPAAGSASA